MGKWDKLKGKYPKLAPDSSYAEKLDAVLDSPAPQEYLGAHDDGLGLTVRCLSDFQLARMYEDVRIRVDQLEADLKAAKLEQEALTREFTGRFEDAGEVSKEFEGGMSLGAGVEPYPVVADQQKMLKWVRDNGLESMLTFNYQTMASYVKQCIEGGKPLPDGVDVFLKDKLTCRGRRKEVDNGGKEGAAPEVRGA